MNRYTYVRNNPLRYTDPDGHAIVTGALVLGYGAVSLAEAAGVTALAIGILHYGKFVAEDAGKWLGEKLFSEAKEDKTPSESPPPDNGEEAENEDIKVIGRKPDCEVAKDWPDHDVLDLPYDEYTDDKNDDWVKDGIDNEQEFYTGSPETSENLEGKFCDEIRQIKDADYEKVGDTYVHPNKVPDHIEKK